MYAKRAVAYHGATDKSDKDRMSSMTLMVEVRKSSDGRLLMVVHFGEDSNLWIHSNGTVSYVPKKSEVELLKDGLEAIDNHNIEKMLKKNLRKED